MQMAQQSSDQQLAMILCAASRSRNQISCLPGTVALCKCLPLAALLHSSAEWKGVIIPDDLPAVEWMSV